MCFEVLLGLKTIPLAKQAVDLFILVDDAIELINVQIRNFAILCIAINLLDFHLLLIGSILNNFQRISCRYKESAVLQQLQNTWDSISLEDGKILVCKDQGLSG